jgi:hypothetical protein
MKDYGQFVVSGNTRVEIEFPCSKCGNTLKEIFKIPQTHKNETMVCLKNGCEEEYDVVIIPNAGTGEVNVPALGEVNQKKIKAQGLP